MEDKLVQCNKCGSPLCYEIVQTGITAYSCFQCGFTTNTLMTENSEFYKEQIKQLPELYKDLSFVDNKDLVWIPTIYNDESIGMVYIYGTSVEDWKWLGVKSKPIPEDEKSKYPIPNKKGQFYQHKIDMSTMKMFDQNGFQDAIAYINETV